MIYVMRSARRSQKDVDQHYQDTTVPPVVCDDHADVLKAATADQLKQLFPDHQAQA
ncbi:hypothetical protein ACFUN7_28115 [Streptomyces sp. NPDC057236]|uniref:hypothetical protein n=1 Tax=Streptomyces sp. NPDC057236 TaxID=3346059 RepID=UPI00363A0494